MNQKNPWSGLPKVAPFILPDDLKLAESDNAFQLLRLDAFPEPFIGRVNTAKIVFLALNPGFIEADVNTNINSEVFMSAARTNLLEQDSPFYYFSERLEFTGGYRWWRNKLKPLLNDGISEQQIANKIACIEYFPYHSIKYRPLKKTLPSQIYGFSLIKQAIKEKRTIIIMRSRKAWIEAVPELNDYPILTLNSPQNVTISPRNVGNNNYARILNELHSR